MLSLKNLNVHFNPRIKKDIMLHYSGNHPLAFLAK